MTIEFNHLNLRPQLVQAVSDLGYTTPTPVQARVIPLMLAGEDVIVQSKTGTGKTAAFSLPVLEHLDPNSSRVQCLVVTPTRELAMQVAQMIYDYGQHTGVSVLAIYGGQPYSRQTRRLSKGVNVVVGTPGRLLDLIRQKALDLSAVRTLVLDEADEMLSMGFIEDVETILQETPPDRQTALFSATMPAQIRKMANRYMNNPQTLQLEQKELTVATIEQRYYLVNEEDKFAALTRIFEVEPITRTLVFARTRLGTAELANRLNLRGFPAEALNGDMNQESRERILERFRQDNIKVLIATDVAARGLDIDDISHVINFDIPSDQEVYVHRIGRTARAGKDGVAISLVTPGEQFRIRKIEAYIKDKIHLVELPTPEDILKKRQDELLNNVTVWLRRGRCKQEQEMVARLVEEGHDLEMIAAVALKLARAEEKQRPIEPVSEVRLRSRQRPARRERQDAGPRGSHEKGMVRLALSRGRRDGIRPNDVVGTIAFHANIPGHSLGKISIKPEYTLVDVPERYVSQVLEKTGVYEIHRQSVEVEVA